MVVHLYGYQGATGFENPGVRLKVLLRDHETRNLIRNYSRYHRGEKVDGFVDAEIVNAAWIYAAFLEIPTGGSGLFRTRIPSNDRPGHSCFDSTRLPTVPRAASRARLPSEPSAASPSDPHSCPSITRCQKSYKPGRREPEPLARSELQTVLDPRSERVPSRKLPGGCRPQRSIAECHRKGRRRLRTPHSRRRAPDAPHLEEPPRRDCP